MAVDIFKRITPSLFSLNLQHLEKNFKKTFSLTNKYFRGMVKNAGHAVRQHFHPSGTKWDQQGLGACLQYNLSSLMPWAFPINVG